MLSIVAVVFGIVKFSEFVGERRGYSKGWQARMRMEKLSPVNTVLEDINTVIRDDHDKCNSELKVAKYLLDMKEEGIEANELKKVLHPEKITATEPTNKKKDKKVVEAFNFDTCNEEANKLKGGRMTEAISICWRKEEIIQRCLYEEGDYKKACITEVKKESREYENRMDDALDAGKPTFYDRVGTAVVKKIEEVKNDN